MRDARLPLSPSPLSPSDHGPTSLEQNSGLSDSYRSGAGSHVHRVAAAADRPRHVVPPDAPLHGERLRRRDRPRAGLRIERVGRIRRQAERDAARPGLHAHVGAGNLPDLDAAAAGLGAHLAADRIGLDVSAAGLGVQASARALDANAARSRLRAHGAVDAADRLVARPGLRVDLRVRGNHELIADG